MGNRTLVAPAAVKKTLAAWAWVPSEPRLWPSMPPTAPSAVTISSQSPARVSSILRPSTLTSRANPGREPLAVSGAALMPRTPDLHRR
jgi:hypothetical protein